jgi:hypothetical protein
VSVYPWCWRRKKNTRVIVLVIARLWAAADARATNMICWMMVMGTGLNQLGGRLVWA